MTLLSLEEVNEHLALPTEGLDDALIGQLMAAAEAHIQGILGYAVSDRFGGDGQPAIPEPLRLAAKMLVGWWYEQREAAFIGAAPGSIPFGVDNLLSQYRDYSF